MDWTFERLRARRDLGEVLGLVLIVVAVVVALSLFSYHAQDPNWFARRPASAVVENWFGRLGALFAEALLQLFGTAAFVTPLALGGAGVRLLLRGEDERPWRIPTWAATFAALAGLLDLLFGSIAVDREIFAAGGWLGRSVAAALTALINGPGATLVATTVLVVGVVLLTGVSPLGLLRHGAVLARRGGVALGARAGEIAGELRRRPWWHRRPAAAPAEPIGAASPPAAATPPAQRPTIPLAATAPTARAVEPPPRIAPPTTPRARPSTARTIEPPRQRALPLEAASSGRYALPTLDLLRDPEPQAIESEQELLERARQMTEKLREFAVNGTVVAIHPGPVVTTFEFKPEAGVKYSKITGMTDDLSLALRAESVRIDRMPGRATVGIEVPNRRQETIYARELFAADVFTASTSKLCLALGKDIGGHVFVANLDKMPHLLIAGATGSGKSVGLNAMIASILYKATPDQVRMIMIDTKMIELGVYADIPHLLVPVVTDPKHASTALKWACREMEQRYRRLAAVGVRNIAQFNELLTREPDRTMDDPRSDEPVPLTALPYIVVVIDELADLMIVASSDVEESIMRLAQMARAVGIHLIIATQRPSVDVITGTIKANFPSRIAFRVSQRVDSRTIIDQQGAEHLLGRGDMLFLSSGSSRLRRLHGSLITETELARVTTFVKKHAQPDYDESILSEGDDELGGVDEADRDEMYLKAVQTVIQDGKCSITLIQRRLQLGYARAARIVDMMEREGVVSQGEGSKPREVLVDASYLEERSPQP